MSKYGRLEEADGSSFQCSYSTAFPSAPIEFPVTSKQGKKRIDLAYIQICMPCWNQPEEDGEYIADSLRVSPEKCGEILPLVRTPGVHWKEKWPRNVSIHDQ